jgi:hypothetical protein
VVKLTKNFKNHLKIILQNSIGEETDFKIKMTGLGSKDEALGSSPNTTKKKKKLGSSGSHL